jgi:hypothetical protein
MKIMTPPEDKPTWGGKRDNQTGRPKIPDDERRIHITARVLPETEAYLRKDGDGVGVAIDKLVRKEVTT